MNENLKIISLALSEAPFYKSWSIIQLHDEIAPEELLQTIFEILDVIGSSNNQPLFSQDRDKDEKCIKLTGFMQMLQYKESSNLYNNSDIVSRVS